MIVQNLITLFNLHQKAIDQDGRLSYIRLIPPADAGVTIDGNPDIFGVTDDWLVLACDLEEDDLEDLHEAIAEFHSIVKYFLRVFCVFGKEIHMRRLALAVDVVHSILVHRPTTNSLEAAETPNSAVSFRVNTRSRSKERA